MPGVGSAHRPWVDAADDRARRHGAGDGRPQGLQAGGDAHAEVTRELLETAGYGLDDVDLLVMHQANLRINEAAQRASGCPTSGSTTTSRSTATPRSATLPICFHEARQAGKAPEGSLVAFAALGAGLHWGAVLMRV